MALRAHFSDVGAMSIRKKFNTNRKLRAPRPDSDERARLRKQVIYVGSPYHKQNPGDFGLTPPSLPRADKTLCDGVGIFKRDIAQALLEEGVARGLVSEQENNGFPQNIWSVTETGMPLEAQLDNREAGTYHGYPRLPHDPLHEMAQR